VPVLGHPAEFAVKSGQVFDLNARDSTDPDANCFDASAPRRKSSNGTLYLARNRQGHPPLSRYKRVIVTIQPE
jgi:hypothetical protein